MGPPSGVKSKTNVSKRNVLFRQLEKVENRCQKYGEDLCGRQCATENALGGNEIIRTKNISENELLPKGYIARYENNLQKYLYQNTFHFSYDNFV